jgi:hypothetical protein
MPESDQRRFYRRPAVSLLPELEAGSAPSFADQNASSENWCASHGLLFADLKLRAIELDGHKRPQESVAMLFG